MSIKLDIAGNKVVASIGKGIAKISEFAHDYAGDYAAVGATVNMPILACSADVFDKQTNNYAQTTTTTEASIALSSQYVAGFEVTPQQMSDGLGAFDGLFVSMGEQAGRSIARSVEAAVVGQVISSESAVSLSATKAGFSGLYKICYDKDLTPENTILVLNPENYSKLIEVLGADITNLQEVIKYGFVDNFLGFRRIVCSSAVDSGLKGFLAEYGAIGVAGRRIPLLEGYPEYAEYIDSETGIPATLVGFQDYKTGSMHITATALFGTSIVDPTHVVPLS